MSFLLASNICSAHLKGDRRVHGRFMQYAGGLHVSTLVVGELHVWALRARATPDRLQSLREMLNDVTILPVGEDVAREFGRVRAALLDQGRPAPNLDLFIACTALIYDLTLMTHKVRDFQGIPDLCIQDWLTP